MPKGRRAGLFNVLAAVFLGLSAISCGWVVEIAMNPYGRLNPFPPLKKGFAPTPVAAVVFPTATETPAPRLDTPTPEPDTPTPEPDTPTPSETVRPTETWPAPSPTPTGSPSKAARPASSTPRPTAVRTLTPSPTVTLTPRPTVTPSPSPTRSVFTYTASIVYQVHPVQVCDWMGVAGTVTDLRGRPSQGVFVHIWGLGNVDQVVAVGAYPIYGPSGWEVRLARAQIVGDWTVQIVASSNARIPLSDAYRISMPGDCKKNLAWVRFQQNH